MPETYRQPECIIAKNVSRQTVFVIPTKYVQSNSDIDFTNPDIIRISLSYINPEGNFYNFYPFGEYLIEHWNESYIIKLYDSHIGDYLIKELKLMIRV